MRIPALTIFFVLIASCCFVSAGSADQADFEVIFANEIVGSHIVGEHTLYGLNAVDAYVSGNFAYAVNLESGFSVIDVSNPLNPDVTG